MKFREAAQVGDDLLGESVAEVLLFRIATQIVEGQYGDGRASGHGQHRVVLDGGLTQPGDIGLRRNQAQHENRSHREADDGTESFSTRPPAHFLNSVIDVDFDAMPVDSTLLTGVEAA